MLVEMRRSSRIPVPNVRLRGTDAGDTNAGDDEDEDQLRAGAQVVVEQLQAARVIREDRGGANGGGDGGQGQDNGRRRPKAADFFTLVLTSMSRFCSGFVTFFDIFWLL